MATSQATMEAMKRESRANAKEDMVTLASDARHKVDCAMAGAQAMLAKAAHPMDKQAREGADFKANSLKRQSSEKQSSLQEMARQQAEQERAAARSLVANQVMGGAAGMRYPVPTPPPPSSASNHPDQQAPQAQAQAHGQDQDQPHQQQQLHPPSGEETQNAVVQ